MKSPAELIAKLRRQWEYADHREKRLLETDDWPLELSIGRPPPRVMTSDLDAVRDHVGQWRKVGVGTVEWEEMTYRAVAEPVAMPARWVLEEPAEWVAVCGDRVMRTEFDALTEMLQGTDAMFHPLLVRRRSLWRGKPVEEVVQAARIAAELEPGCADGLPLRALAMEGIDTKFFERHGGLVTALLDVRFDGEVGRLGLEAFLGAHSDGDHWLLVLDLDGGLLPFEKQRVRSSELRTAGLPGERVLIVENESCQHLLPPVPGAVAILGAGFDLSWTDAEWLGGKRVAYWGDLDTWGLRFLAKARASMPHLTPLLMRSDVFDEHAGAAVTEPVSAGSDIPNGLTDVEAELYRRLSRATRCRLEQEFLPASLVQEAVERWVAT